MKRTEVCPRCGGSGRNPAIVCKDAEGKDIDAHCDLCAGTGRIGVGEVPQMRVPVNHPRAAEIARLLEEGS